MRRYGAWAGNTKGNPEDTTRCAAEIREPGPWPHFRQCSRKRGHGEGGLLCRRHAEMRASESGHYVSIPEDRPAAPSPDGMEPK